MEKTLLQAPNKAENAESAENAGNATEESPSPGKGGKPDRSERIKDALGVLLNRPNKVSKPSGRTNTLQMEKTPQRAFPTPESTSLTGMPEPPGTVKT